MKKISLLTVATAAILGLAAPYAQAAPGAPAQAPGPRELRLTSAGEVTMPVPEGAEAPAQKAFSVSLRAKVKGHHPLVKHRISFDLTALKGKVDWKVWYGPSCKRTGEKAVCESHTSVYDALKVAIVKLSPAKGTAPGFTGDIKVTGEVPGATVKPWNIKVNVGGPDLAVQPLSVPGTVAVGAAVRLPLAFSNGGTAPARNVLLWLRTSNGLDFTTKYGNCTYGLQKKYFRKVALCTVPGTFGVNGDFRTTTSPVLKARQDGAAETIDYGVFQDSEARRRQLTRGGSNWVRGTGTALKVAADSTAPLSGDLDDHDNWTSERLQIKNRSEFTAVGGAVRGRSGQTVTASFGFDFAGPGRSYTEAEAELTTRVTLPAGVTATATPENCHAVRRGGNAYDCVEGTREFLAGDKLRYPFTLKIDRIDPAAKGEVRVFRSFLLDDPDMPGSGSGRPEGDTNPKDDRAKITVVTS
ncbi:hypothetical protein ACM614_29370 [Streptomyces sp. 12297]